MFEYKFKITNLTCEACIKLSNMVLKSLPGVKEVQIDFDSGDTKVMSEKEIDWEDIKNNLAKVDKIAQK